jgi:hypothetical protein
MKRALAATVRILMALAVLALAGTPALAASRERKGQAQIEAQLRATMAVLASDEYGGREPGTEGETLTLRYLARQWFDIGLRSGTNDPAHAWFQPVTIVAHQPDRSLARFVRKGRAIFVPQDEVLVLTSGERSLVEKAPVLFVGTASDIPPRAELAGRVALLLAGDRSDETRQSALLAGGAAAVITVLDGPLTLDAAIKRRRLGGYALADETPGGDLEAFVTVTGVNRILAGARLDLAALQHIAAALGFAPQPLNVTVTLEATTRETRIRTHNLIGKLPARRPAAGAVLILAHWDHFGVCAPEGAPHRICNGAVDNASGVAALTEIARALAAGPPLERDVYFLATTGEELGLLGARAFAEDPPLPLDQIVAAFNIDTVAIAPRGTPLAIVGKGLTSLDPVIAAVAKAQRMKLVDSPLAASFEKRQDGWALIQHDVPAVQVSTAFGDPERFQHFIDTDYHRPGDVMKPDIELGGAVQDVEFLTALAQWCADPKKLPLHAK